jgi:hypothetical protein
MLGTTGVGKTTFLTAMYYELGQVGRNGFKLRADRNSHIVLSRNWKELVQSHIWPKPNADYSEFRLELRHGDDHIKEFDFVDYRGGAVTDLKEEEHYQKLSNDVERSDALLILADSWYIANKSTAYAEEQNEIHNIQWFLEEYLLKNKDKKLSIGIVLTKIDTLQADQYEEFKTKCFSVFKSILDLAKTKQDRLKMSFIPISVVGYDTCDIKVNKQNGRTIMECDLIDDPKPVNVHWPIIYCIAKSIEFRIETLDEAISNKKDEWIEIKEKKSGIWNYLTAIFDGEKLPYQKANDIYNEIENKKGELSRLQVRIEPLIREIAVLGEVKYDEMHVPPQP